MKPHITAALILCAPTAAQAEIRLSGQAVMGLAFENGKTETVSETQFTLHASRVTDGGIEFGAVIDLNPAPTRAFRNDPPRAFISMSTGNLSVQAGNNVPSAGSSRR